MKTVLNQVCQNVFSILKAVKHFRYDISLMNDKALIYG